MPRKPRPEPTLPIEAVAEVLSRADGCLSGATPDVAAAAEALSSLVSHAEILAMPRYEGHARPLKACAEALARGDARGARRHLGRVARVLRPAANDRPFEVQDRVSVTRSRHGWHDGLTQGVVKSRHASKEGSWSYVVRSDEGEDLEVRRTRDMSPAR